jgi:hypothetical protein
MPSTFLRRKQFLEMRTDYFELPFAFPMQEHFSAEFSSTVPKLQCNDDLYHPRFNQHPDHRCRKAFINSLYTHTSN